MDKFRCLLVQGLIWIWISGDVIDCNILDEDFHSLCSQRCPFQNKTKEHFDVGCGTDCKIEQCSRGCLLWRKALESSCQTVCNGTQNTLSQKELHCVMGCNDAINQYFQKLKDEIGIPPAPYLVADTLTATSLSLAWEGARYSDISYLVQWRYEEHAGAWQYCRNQSWGPNSVVLVENLQPYTKYRFRVALLLSPHSEPIVSEPSVVINTLAAGVPSSPPIIIRATAVDSKRISVSWKPGPFPNGPIHSYVVELVGEFTSLKEDIPATKTTDFYMFQNLNANSKYVVSIAMRNAVGEGPAAIAEISTPPEPSVKDTLQPILILGSKHRVIKQGADMMLDVPVVIYESSNLITGIGIHVGKNLLFISDSAGYVSVTSLKKYTQPKHMLIPSETNFKPLDLSVDWLNNHLYILGEISHRKSTLWQVARCGLDGKGLTVAVAGIMSKPLHIEVDPYNGYLFWLIQGHNRGGLYRLDLANISNGIKREVIPDLILEDPNLGAFVVDHTNFCILVPNHAKNTVFSVSLDGRNVLDMRSNTQQALFQNVISLAIANGLFYWTNGEEVLAEDYHEEYHTYFHNHYLGSKNRSYISVSVDLPTSQPIPVPVNPPIHVQAVLGGHVAKITWQTPHLVGGQGKGAWQNWSYEIQIRNERTGEIRTHSDINNTTFVTIEDLEEDTEYVIKAAAYTSSGNGPWSSKFRGKTLRAPENGHYPTILWSAAEGLLQSDVTGEEVETLISQEKLKDYHFVDIAWFQDKLYLVTNTTRVYWYNLTSREYRRIHHLDSVGSVAVDWIGEKLYWSNPKQQVILRGDLEGKSQENLLILTIAKELNTDPEHAFIYWSTGLAVECARLNGDGRRVYYPAEWFPGKHVKGLTLNMDDRHVYWIVRSNEGSTLYKAPMAHYSGPATEEIVPIKISSLQHPNMQGPLCYFSDHLLWLQDNKNAVIGDLSGQNEAVISGMSLSGLNMVAVMDTNVYEKFDKNVNVIPEPIDESTIRIVGSSRSFNITWEPVRNVNFGEVFYELKTEDYKNQTYIRTMERELVYDRELRPYSELQVTLQAFTYWGSSTPVKRVIHSPESPPSAPTNPRVFVTRKRNSTTGETNIIGLFRWDTPKEPNGLLTLYRVRSWYYLKDVKVSSHTDLYPEKLELTMQHLVENAVYYFQVQAFTSAGEGKYTETIFVNTSVESPVPTLLVASKDSIIMADCDREIFKILFSGDQPTDVAINSREGTVYWLNEMHEILSIAMDGGGKTKIHTLNGTGVSLAIDWVGRFLYWSELEERDQSSPASCIYRMDLNQIENGFTNVEKIVRRTKRIEQMEISPFTNAIYWIEVNRHGTGHLMESKMDGTDVRPIFPIQSNVPGGQCTCPENPKVGRTFAADQTNPRDVLIIYNDDVQGHIYQTAAAGCDCRILLRSTKFPLIAIATDHQHLYWNDEGKDVVFMLKDGSVEARELMLRGVKKIRAVGSHLQPLPSLNCLIPRQSTATPILLDNTAKSITLRLPKPEREGGCNNISLASVQYTIYFGMITDGGTSECIDRISSCREIITYSDTIIVDDLKPFSSYVFMTSLKNYYTELKGITSIIGPPVVFETSAGAPSPPQNVTVIVLDPTVVEVGWYPPRDLNDRVVWYEVHWRTEGTIAGVRQSGEQIVQETDRTDGSKTYKKVTIKKLLPGQLYLIWVRAYSQNSDKYRDSEGVEVETFQQPDNITLLEATPYSLLVRWIPPANCTLDYQVQYSNSTGEWVTIRTDASTAPGTYLIRDLSPKTHYRFRTLVMYLRSKEPYIWPQDRGFHFETLGDRPSRPGTPVIQHLRRDVYQVIWEKSRDNGAEIEFYILEGRFRTAWRAKREANYTMQDSNKVDLEEWIIYYNGTDNYWIITELSPSLKYVFRVKAKNRYGWSDSSETSKSFDFTEAAMLADQQDLGIVLITTVPLVLVFCIVVLVTFCCFSKKRDKEKKDLKILTLATRNPGPDVELATLRELPRRGNFIHNANILYVASPDPPTDEEIALLPPVRRDQFKLTKFLGSGAFGEVYEGVAQGLPGAPDVETRVAIKALRKGASEQEKAEFLKEAQLMSHFKHEHILQLLGVCLDNDPNYILMELMEGGDLLSYLRLNRPLIATSNAMQLEDLLAMCVDVAKGCRYLEEMHFVHRDLACRNCLVSSTDPRTRIVKIGDFGLARDIYKNDYYRKEGEGLLPVRWMAPESLIDGVFTSQSDVWAFGVLIWEIMTLGQQPYPARTNLEVLHYVRTGGRLGRPNNCSEDLYQLMQNCWSFNPENRPTFKYCLESLKDLKSRTANATLRPDMSEYLEVRTGGKKLTQGIGYHKQFKAKPGMKNGTSGGFDIGDDGDDDFEDGVENNGFHHEETDGNSGAVEMGDERRETSPTPHRYLELIYDEEVPSDVGDGYEVPRLPNSKLPGRCRTFSSSSIASEGSASTVSYLPSAPLVEAATSGSATYFAPDLSSLQKLLPNGTVPNGFKREMDSDKVNLPANVS